MKTNVRAAELATLLDQAPPGIEYLSLDCFDTLLWRNVQAPHDIFADLAIEGGGVLQRSLAESRARSAAKMFGREDVTIEEIYRIMRPAASDAEIATAVEAEIDAEARHCFAFAPAVALIRAAKMRGLKLIIVSDTYLNPAQLRQLIARAAGEEVASAIDAIFCSSDHHVGKAQGLFGHVLAALNVAGGAILHVGDNKSADYEGALPFGIHAVHFRQFDAACARRFRLEAGVATLLDPQIRATVPAFQPHRAQCALRVEEDPDWTLGHDVLGPLMHSFVQWLKDEASAMAEATGKKVKLLFLLRDGHLPHRVFEAAFGGAFEAAALEVSRFTARCASFVDQESLRSFVSVVKPHGRIDVLAHQMLLTDAEARTLTGGVPGVEGQSILVAKVLEPENVATIAERSAAFAERLLAHVRNLGVEDGDAVMLVDLGYNGTLQNLLEPLLRDRMGLTVAGRYLLLCEDFATGLDKKGLIDRRNYDARILHALCRPVAVLDELCTIAQGSVIDYDPGGTPLREDADKKGTQNRKRTRIQEACIAFSRDADCGFDRPPASDTPDARRRMAAAILGRLLYLPTETEVQVFSEFRHDINLGSDDMVDMLDIDAAALGLRRKGLSYFNDVKRIYTPCELQPHGLQLNLALFSAQLFGLDLRAADFRGAEISLPVFLADNDGQVAIQSPAHVTHDGYYLATIPVGSGRFAVGVQIGALCEWLQIEEIGFYPVDGFIPKNGAAGARIVPAQVIKEGLHEQAPGLYRCDPDAMLLVPPPRGLGDTPHLLSFAFRPLAFRDQQLLRKAA
jgi:FMN phosphatase YigB (HAD superfamily)